MNRSRNLIVACTVALVMVAAIASGAAVAVWVFLPKLEYLPEGNRNLVFGLLIPPPGYNLETTETIAQRIEAVARPMWEASPAAETADGTPAREEPGCRAILQGSPSPGK